MFSQDQAELYAARDGASTGSFGTERRMKEADPPVAGWATSQKREVAPPS
jgi:hypothetical protein